MYHNDEGRLYITNVSEKIGHIKSINKKKGAKHMGGNIFEMEKKILKAQNVEEIDAITANMSKQELQNMVKLLVDRLTPVNVKINRIINS